MRKLDLTNDAISFLQSCPPKHGKQIAQKIQLLITDPLSANAQELKGSSGYYRVKSGEYRIIYSFDEIELKVWLVGKRNDDEIYKRFMRKQ